MPTPEEAEKKALARMYKAVQEAKQEAGDNSEDMDYMTEVAEQAVAKAREHRGQPIGVNYSEFAVEVAKLAAKLAKVWVGY